METDLQLAKMVKLYKNAVCEGQLEVVFVISPFIARLCQGNLVRQEVLSFILSSSAY